MAEFLNREAGIDLRAELAKAPEPELTPEAFDGGDGEAGAPDTDARRYGEKRLPRLAQELTRAPPRLAGPDVLESGAGATPFVAARPVAPA